MAPEPAESHGVSTLQSSPVYDLVQEELGRIKDNLKKGTALQSPFLSEVLEYVFDTSGKRMRPAITLLASKFHPNDGKKPEIMATAVELLHVATLIHDDTVDSSDYRRGKATVSRVWGRNVAVLVGDYICAASATYVCRTENIKVISRFAETIMQLSSGELQEIADSFDHGQTRAQYLKRISDKTASLFSTAGESGALLSGGPEQIVQALREYGHNIGMAFQIVDDILDFEGTQEEIGKPVGADLSHGIMTLPALIAMERYPERNPIPELFQRPEDENCLTRCVEMIQDSSIISDSYSVAEGFCRKAAQALQTLPRNPSRDALESIVEYVLERRK